MKTFAQVSYNIHCNFTNYGSALQSWALSQAIKKLGYRSVLVDYCPDYLKDKDPLNPMKNMWDTDEESRKMCELSLPAIRINYEKFEKFYTEQFNRSKRVYTKENFNDIVLDENIDGFICGSDTIFCVDEFGMDDGYYANYPAMRDGYSIAYAASFGDSHFNEETYKILNHHLGNFKALGIRENWMIPYIKEHSTTPVQQVLDPTLLMTKDDFETIAISERLEEQKYLLLYARRYNKKMFDYAEEIAAKNGWKVVDISLRATNADKHRMFYEAGVEEFLSLVRHAEFLVTNSYHGMIMGVHYRRPFVIFSREQCDIKIDEVLELMGLSDRKLVQGDEKIEGIINYDDVHQRIKESSIKSMAFLAASLKGCGKCIDFQKKFDRLMQYINDGIPIVQTRVTTLSANNLLEGRNALITGGTSGIGFEIAKAFVMAGAKVVITGRSLDRVENACHIINQSTGIKGRAFGLEMDNTKVCEFEKHIETAISLFGVNEELDILVNNAGVLGGHITSATELEYDLVLDTNLKGTFFLTKVVAKYMKANKIKGNILNICSSSGVCPANSAYCVSKWGIRGLTEGFARSLAPLGIVVNGIAPGPTATPMLLHDNSDLSHGKIPLGRYAMPEEIANMAVILVSSLGRTVVGDILYMTGGAGNITKENIKYNF